MSGTEKDYDDVIAPLLMKVVEQCKALGMSIVARVEWSPEESGITQSGIENASVGQKLTQLAAHSHENFDLLAMTAQKSFDCSRSLVLKTPSTTHDWDAMRPLYPEDRGPGMSDF